MRISFRLAAVCLAIGSAACVRPAPTKADLSVASLRTNDLDNPLAVPGFRVLFSWKTTATGRDVAQTGWEVRVAHDADALATAPSWDSGWVASGEQVMVPYAGPALDDATPYVWQVRLRDNKGRTSAWSRAASFETDLGSSPWHAGWIGATSPAADSAIFRKRFDLPAQPVRARLYVTALGVYRMFLNGARTDADYLAPGWTDYDKRIQYQTYDVTRQVHAGRNVLAAMLGPGWYAGHIASFGAHKYGASPLLSAQLRLDFADGTSSWVNTDGTWLTAPGPFRQADIIMGETYDAAGLPSHWNLADASPDGWQPARVADRQDQDDTRLHAQSDEPVRITGQRPATILARQPTPGAVIYDLGQNMVGVVRLQFNAHAGQDIRLRYGEVLNPDGSLYTANLRTAKATDHYLPATGGEQAYTPTFTYHGFRYVEITGLAAPTDVRSLTGLVLGSDLRRTGSFEVGDAMLTQLQSNITWGARGNFVSIPTDTPARDERLGWAGDINVFAPTASFNQDTLNFLSKWLRDLRDAQTPDGNYPGVAPNPPNIESGSGWSDAGITVPYTLWMAYGDPRVIRDGYESMKRFMARIETIAGPEGRRVHGPWGDWLHLDDPTPPELIGTAYLAYDAQLMTDMAKAIGRDEDAAYYAALATRLRGLFDTHYLHADGSLGSNSQTGYAMAIGMGLVEPSKVGAALVRAVHARNDHLSTGFLGTPWLLPALSASGHDDLAYRLLLNRDYPSWGYEIAHGATTMWERWNSLKPDGSFGDVEMNSFNHYAYGAVGDWMYRNIAGIAPAAPGYRVVTIAPHMGGGLTQGGGKLDSPYGDIVTAWRLVAGTLELDVTIPVNATATVAIPSTDPSRVTEGGKALGNIEGASSVTEDRHDAHVTIGSGTYAFRAPFATPAR
jgi:alpha-L-rhamnosidase-like protein